MKHRFLALVAAFALAVSGALTPGTVAATTYECWGSTFIQDNYQMFIKKDIADVDVGQYGVFDHVQGDAYLRVLDACNNYYGDDPNGSYVLPANVQTNDTGHAFQLGYGYEAKSANPSFYYALGSPPVAVRITGVTPVVGNRYRYEITRDANAHPDFKITNLTASPDQVVWTYTSSVAGWGYGFDTTWWGYETLDSHSHMGVDEGLAGVDMSTMGFSALGTSSIWYRSGPSVQVWQNDIAYQAWPHYEVLGHWQYGNDRFNVYSSESPW